MENIDPSNEHKNEPLSIEEVARLFGVPPHLLSNDLPESPCVKVITFDELFAMSKWKTSPLFAKQVKRALLLKRKNKCKKKQNIK